jgi:hypothetical protein
MAAATVMTPGDDHHLGIAPMCDPVISFPGEGATQGAASLTSGLARETQE